KKAEKKAAGAAPGPRRFAVDRLMNVVLAPVVSEKSTFVADKNRQYVFRVADDATKPQIKAAVELMFKTKVEGGASSNAKGKERGWGRAGGGRRGGKRARGARAGARKSSSGPTKNPGPAMPLLKVKPTSPGRRALVKVVTPELHKGDPHWALTRSQIRGSGRNTHGRITTRHQGGGHKHHL